MKKVNLSFSVICIFILCYITSAQNIVNTIAANGVFRIKDGSVTYFTLSQSNGQAEFMKTLKLQSTTDFSTGVIYKGNNRFIHDYKFAQNMGNNLFVGVNSGNFSLGSFEFAEASMNSGFGVNTLSSLTSGHSNIAVGYNSLQLNTSGHSNVSVGIFSLANNITGSFNVALGDFALSNNSGGIGNVAVGYNALPVLTSGNQNCAIGSNALYSTTTGADNTALGSSSMYLNTTGFNNTAVGESSLYSNNGAHNTAIGYNSGANVTTGSNLNMFGYNSQPSTGNASNQITLGNNFISSLRCNVQTITSLSDARDKKNVKDLSLGLDFIMMMKPRQFNWDKREWYEGSLSDGSKMQEMPTAGFIAQELDVVQTSENAEWLNLVFKDNPEKMEATYGNLLPVMVKAIQELKSENDELKKEIENLKSIEERLTLIELTVLKEKTLKEVKTAGK